MHAWINKLRDRYTITHDKEGNEVEKCVVSGFLSMDTNGTFHHGVLPHENHGVTTKTATNALELVRSDIVGVNNKDLGEFIDELAELSIVILLLLSFCGFDRHC